MYTDACMADISPYMRYAWINGKLFFTSHQRYTQKAYRESYKLFLHVYYDVNDQKRPASSTELSDRPCEFHLSNSVSYAEVGGTKQEKKFKDIPLHEPWSRPRY